MKDSVLRMTKGEGRKEKGIFDLLSSDREYTVKVRRHDQVISYQISDNRPLSSLFSIPPADLNIIACHFRADDRESFCFIFSDIISFVTTSRRPFEVACNVNRCLNHYHRCRRKNQQK